MNPDLNEFLEWAKQSRQRKVDIEIKEGQPVIHVFDFAFGYYCQRVNSVSEIDLEKESTQRKKAEYERLKAEFESEVKSA